MIEKLIGDAQTLMQDSQKSEANAQRAYEELLSDTNGSVEALQRDAASKAEALSDAKQDMLRAESGLSDTEKELEGFGIRLNKKPPEIILRKKEKGGINITNTGIDSTHLTKEMISSVLKEYKINNADVTIRCDATVDELIDVIEGNRIYIPCIYVLNKIDSITIEELDLLSRVPHYVPICARKEWNFDDLLEKIWNYLDMYRVYTKPRGQIPDYDAPVVVPRDHNTVEDFCLRIHKSLVAQFKYALVWGNSVKHNPQRVGKEHKLSDEDIVQIVKKV